MDEDAWVEKGENTDMHRDRVKVWNEGDEATDADAQEGRAEAVQEGRWIREAGWMSGGAHTSSENGGESGVRDGVMSGVEDAVQGTLQWDPKAQLKP